MIKTAKKVIRTAIQSLRKATASSRPLPDFIIIGAQKAGTTSLYDYLNQHRQIRMSTPLKEVHYFSYDYSKGLDWYKSNFPIVPNKQQNDLLVGEASPYYLFHPHSAKRMHDVLPDIKIIAILRNPTDRAISHYFHELRHNTETLDIIDALNAEEQRIGPELQKMLDDPNYESRTHQNLSYKARGRYAEQLERYYQYYDKDTVLVLTSDELFNDTTNCLKAVYDFLGIKTELNNIDTTPSNVGSNKKKIDDEVYQYLNDYFKEENKRLAKLIDKDLNW